MVEAAGVELLPEGSPERFWLCLAGQESAPRTNLLPKGFVELESFEVLFENAGDDRVDTDAFLFRPLPQGGPSLSSDVKQLRRT